MNELFLAIWLLQRLFWENTWNKPLSTYKNLPQQIYNGSQKVVIIMGRNRNGQQMELIKRT